MLTAKQTAARQYYRLNRDRIKIQKRKYQADHREEINAGVRRRRNKSFNRRCFLCGGVVVEDEGSAVWQCLNQECEAEFKEIL